MIHDTAERIADEHIRWLHECHREGYQHVWEALALARHTTTFALKVAYPRLRDALAASWLMLPRGNDDRPFHGATVPDP